MKFKVFLIGLIILAFILSAIAYFLPKISQPKPTEVEFGMRSEKEVRETQNNITQELTNISSTLSEIEKILTE
jgi:hypothetical protein